MKIIAVMLATYREAVRNKIMYSFVLAAAVLIGISTFFGAVTIGKQEDVVKDFGLFICTFFGVIVTITTGVSIVQRELKQKTIFNILSKPISRWQFFVGKYCGLLMTVGTLISLMGIGLVLYLKIITNQLDLSIGLGILFGFMEIAIVAGVVMFFSAIVVTPALTALFAMGTYIAGHSVSYLTMFMADTYSSSIRNFAKGLEVILPNLNLFVVNSQIVYGEQIGVQYVASAALYTACYVIITLALGSWFFQRREFI